MNCLQTILHNCRTCFSMGDLGVQVSVRLFVRPCVRLSVRQHFQWVSSERNYSYSYLLIFLKLCRCFLHGVRMCMWFGYNCWIIFYHFFHFVNLVIFRPQCVDSGYLVSTTPHTILYQSFWNFAHVFSMVWRCAYGLDIILAFIFVTFSTLRTLSFSDLRFYENVVTVGTLWAQLLIQFYTDLFETLYIRHGLEMCIWFGYNPWINFCYFFHFVNFVIFWPQILWKSRDSGYLVSATPHTILYLSLWNFAHVFAMVWRCARDLDVILELIFVTFYTLWTLSFLTSDSMKVYRQWLPCKRNSLYNFMPVFMQLCTSFFPWFEDVHVVWI